jgi:hypothetical protein
MECFSKWENVFLKNSEKYDADENSQKQDEVTVL